MLHNQRDFLFISAWWPNIPSPNLHSRFDAWTWRAILARHTDGCLVPKNLINLFQLSCALLAFVTNQLHKMCFIFVNRNFRYCILYPFINLFLSRMDPQCCFCQSFAYVCIEHLRWKSGKFLCHAQFIDKNRSFGDKKRPIFRQITILNQPPKVKYWHRILKKKEKFLKRCWMLVAY